MSVISNIRTGNSSIDGLIHNKKWEIKNITYSFPRSAYDYGSFYPRESISYFREASEPIKRKVREFFEEIESIINVKFIECEANPGRAVIRIAQSFVRDPQAYMPDNHNCAGDVWFPITNEYRVLSDGSFAHHAIHHEIGHALGLKHPHEVGAFGRLPQEYDSSRFTVMSYNAERDNQSLGCGLDQYPQSFMPLDILALQTLYGRAVSSPNSGTHNFYSWDPVTGHGFRDGQYRNKASGNYVFETIVDDGGWDTFDFSKFKRDLNIDLRPGGASHVMPCLQRYGVAAEQTVVCTPITPANDPRFFIEAAIGGNGSDIMRGNDGANHLSGQAGHDRIMGCGGDDWLDGGEGDDVLSGGRGDDVLRGGTGRNLFVIAPGDGHDLIEDFRCGSGNLIDLRCFGLARPDDVVMWDIPTHGGSVTLHLVASNGAGVAQLTLMGMTTQEIRSDVLLL